MTVSDSAELGTNKTKQNPLFKSCKIRVLLAKGTQNTAQKMKFSIKDFFSKCAVKNLSFYYKKTKNISKSIFHFDRLGTFVFSQSFCFQLLHVLRYDVAKQT